jgi:hypothetical protein
MGVPIPDAVSAEIVRRLLTRSRTQKKCQIIHCNHPGLTHFSFLFVEKRMAICKNRISCRRR